MIKNHVDAINITDNQTSVTRLSSLASCIHLKLMGLEPILQMVVRGPETASPFKATFWVRPLSTFTIFCACRETINTLEIPHRGRMFSISIPCS